MTRRSYEPDPGFLVFSQSGFFGGLFSLCIVWMDDLRRRWGKNVLETTAEMDGKLVLETTTEVDSKPDT